MGLIIRNGIIYAGGASGKSAYEQAVEGGYQGTEAQFNAILATAGGRLTDLESDLGDLTDVLAAIADIGGLEHRCPRAEPVAIFRYDNYRDVVMTWNATAVEA